MSPGEPGYQPLYDPRETHTLDDWDRFLIDAGRAPRAPTAAERRGALNGSMFGWHVPAADPLNCEDTEAGNGAPAPGHFDEPEGWDGSSPLA